MLARRRPNGLVGAGLPCRAASICFFSRARAPGSRSIDRKPMLLFSLWKKAAELIARMLPMTLLKASSSGRPSLLHR